MKWVLVLFLSIFIFTACSPTPDKNLGKVNNESHTEITADETADEFITKKGYEVIGDASQQSSYVLEKEMLREMPYNMYWSVQDANPTDFLGKEIATIGFEVRNHPLQEIYDSTAMIFVMLAEGKAIGGYSWPKKEGLAGWVYTVDGKTLEEKTGLTYGQWLDDWQSKWNK